MPPTDEGAARLLTGRGTYVDDIALVTGTWTATKG